MLLLLELTRLFPYCTLLSSKIQPRNRPGNRQNYSPNAKEQDKIDPFGQDFSDAHAAHSAHNDEAPDTTSAHRFIPLKERHTP